VASIILEVKYHNNYLSSLISQSNTLPFFFSLPNQMDHYNNLKDQVRVIFFYSSSCNCLLFFSSTLRQQHVSKTVRLFYFQVAEKAHFSMVNGTNLIFQITKAIKDLNDNYISRLGRTMVSICTGQILHGNIE